MLLLALQAIVEAAPAEATCRWHEATDVLLENSGLTFAPSLFAVPPTSYACISQDTGKFVFGVKDTLTCLDMGAVETLIVWENLDMQRYVFTNTTSGGCACLPVTLYACLPAASCHITWHLSSPPMLRCLPNNRHCCLPLAASPAACCVVQVFKRSSS